VQITFDGYPSAVAASHTFAIGPLLSDSSPLPKMKKTAGAFTERFFQQLPTNWPVPCTIGGSELQSAGLKKG
jgi:hypothetical protein